MAAEPGRCLNWGVGVVAAEPGRCPNWAVGVVAAVPGRCPNWAVGVVAADPGRCPNWAVVVVVVNSIVPRFRGRDICTAAVYRAKEAFRKDASHYSRQRPHGFTDCWGNNRADLRHICNSLFFNFRIKIITLSEE